MGRGDRAKSDRIATGRRGGGKAQARADELLRGHERLIRTYEAQMSRAVRTTHSSLEDQTTAKSKALSNLTYDDISQRRVIKAAREAHQVFIDYSDLKSPAAQELAFRARKLDQSAREIFILCHSGYVEGLINRHVHRLEGESPEEARVVLRQAARIGLNKAIECYDFSNPAKPLTYATGWIRHEIKSETERGRRVRLKSKAHDLGDKIEALCKKIENEGRQVTVAELSDRLGVPVQRVAEILPFARRQMVRLDAPVSSDGDSTTIGALTVDTRQEVENPILDDDARQRVRLAVASMASPLHRRVLELYHGLADNEEVEQKDLFDGVYRDKKGNLYSAEPSVIADRKRQGQKVKQVSQRVLNERFKNDELDFVPGTPEAAELARAALGEIDRTARFERSITRLTGVPPTSGTIQEAKRKAEEELRKSPLLQGLAPTYRGDNELENSERAREQVRVALVNLGAVSKKEADERLGSTRSSNGGKSSLRRMAEEHGLVDPASGRRNLTAIEPLLDEEPATV